MKTRKHYLGDWHKVALQIFLMRLIFSWTILFMFMRWWTCRNVSISCVEQLLQVCDACTHWLHEFLMTMPSQLLSIFSNLGVKTFHQCKSWVRENHIDRTKTVPLNSDREDPQETMGWVTVTGWESWASNETNILHGYDCRKGVQGVFQVRKCKTKTRYKAQTHGSPTWWRSVH